jgi:hypothetical protein
LPDSWLTKHWLSEHIDSEYSVKHYLILFNCGFCRKRNPNPLKDSALDLRFGFYAKSKGLGQVLILEIQIELQVGQTIVNIENRIRFFKENIGAEVRAQ